MAERLPTQEDPTIGKLVADVSRDVSSLVQKEIQLAKSELQVSAKAGAMSIALFAAAGFVALLGIILLSITLVYLIRYLTDWDLLWCYLVITGVYFVIAAVLGLVGKAKTKGVRPPKKAIAQAQETKAVLKRG